MEDRDYNPNSMSDWVPIAETNHQQYPVTKIKWEPYKVRKRNRQSCIAMMDAYTPYCQCSNGPFLAIWIIGRSSIV